MTFTFVRSSISSIGFHSSEELVSFAIPANWLSNVPRNLGQGQKWTLHAFNRSR